MRLSNFILENIDTILREWEEFAATLVPAEHKTDRVMLRDHAKKMLETIAADLGRPQTAQEQAEKSKGHDDSPAAKETPADMHGAERDHRFSIRCLLNLETAIATLRLWFRHGRSIEQAVGRIKRSGLAPSLDRDKRIARSLPDLIEGQAGI